MVLPTRRCLFVLLILVSGIYAARPDRYMASSSMESTTILPILSSSSASGTMVYDGINSSKTTSEAYLNHSSSSHPRTSTGKISHNLTANEHAVRESQENVLITGFAENVELLVTSGLTIGVNLDRCHSQLLVCYDADPGSTPSSWAQTVCQSATQCALAFQEDRYNRDIIEFNGDKDIAHRKRVPGYSEATMTSGFIEFFDGMFFLRHGCAPKIEDGVVVLRWIKASYECPVTIRNAKLKPVPATSDPSSDLPTDAYGNVIKSTTPGASESSFPAWKVIVIILGILVFIIIAIIIIYCVLKNRKKKQPVSVLPPKSTSNHATENTYPVVTVKPEPVKVKHCSSRKRKASKDSPHSPIKPKTLKLDADKKVKSEPIKEKLPGVKKVPQVKAVAECLPPRAMDPILEPVKEISQEKAPEVEAKLAALLKDVKDAERHYVERPPLCNVKEQDDELPLYTSSKRGDIARYRPGSNRWLNSKSKSEQKRQNEKRASATLYAFEHGAHRNK